MRFSTDSDLIAIHATMNRIGKMPHIPLTGSAGFDLYVDDPATGTSRYFRTFMPPFDIVDGYEAAVCFPSRKLRYLTVQLRRLFQQRSFCAHGKGNITAADRQEAHFRFQMQKCHHFFREREFTGR